MHQREELTRFLRSARARLAACRCRPARWRAPPCRGAAPRGSRNALGHERHLVHLVRAGPRRPALGADARTVERDAAPQPAATRVHVRAGAAPPAAAVAAARRRGPPRAPAPARRAVDTRAGHHRGLDRHRLEPPRAAPVPRLWRACPIRPTATCSRSCSRTIDTAPSRRNIGRWRARSPRASNGITAGRRASMCSRR